MRATIKELEGFHKQWLFGVSIVAVAVLLCSVFLMLAFFFTPKDTSSAAERVALGYIYNETNGNLVTGATVAVTGPGVITINDNGSATGIYDFITDGTEGLYQITVTPPAGYQTSRTCLEQKDAYYPTGTATNTLGSNQTASTLNDFSCAANPYHLEFYLTDGNPTTTLNNIPLTQDLVFSGEPIFDLTFGTYLGITGGDGEGKAIKRLADGTVIAVANGVDYDNVKYAGYTNLGTGDTTNGDIAIIKMTSSGVFISGAIIGGSAADTVAGVAEDSSGNIFISGGTASSDLPVGAGFDTSYVAGNDGFIIKLNSTLTSVLGGTYLGSSGTDSAGSIKIATDDTVYVMGQAGNADFMASSTTGAATFTSSFGGSEDGYLARLDNNLANATYVRYVANTAAASEQCMNGDFMSDGDFVVYCQVYATGASTTNAYDSSFAGSADGYLMRLASDGVTVDWATYHGGSALEGSSDNAETLVIDSNDNIYHAMTTYSTQGTYDAGVNTLFTNDGTYAGNSDTFLTQFSSTGTPLWATYVGTAAGYEEPNGLTLDGSERPVLWGLDAFGGGIGTTPFAIKTARQGNREMYYQAYSTTGTLLASSYYGTVNDDRTNFAHTDNEGGVLVAAETHGDGMPVTAGVPQSNHSNGASSEYDAYFARFNIVNLQAQAVTLVTTTVGAVVEAGATTSYGVRLATEPTTTVYINLSPDTDITLSTTTLAFDAFNYSVTQTVIITAVDDSIVEGSEEARITMTVSSTGYYEGIPVDPVRVTVTDNDSPGVTINTTGMVSPIDEDQTLFATFTIQLAASPSTTTVDVILSPDAQSTLSTTSIRFTTSTWNVPIVVTSTAIDDFVAEGAHSTTITVTASSTDAFNAVAAQNVNISITDNDSAAGITVTETNGSTDVVEGYVVDTFTVVLDTVPSSSVTVDISDATAAQLNFSTTSIIFTTTSWSTPVIVTTTPVDDATVEGAHTAAINVWVTTSTDSRYMALATSTITANITDNDTAAGITVTESSGSTAVAEGGTTDSFTVVLNAYVTSTLQVSLVDTSATAEVTLSTSTITFTSSTWNTAQTITVTAVDDTDIEGTHTTPVAVWVTSSSVNTYLALATSTVTVSIADNDGTSDSSAASTGGGIAALALSNAATNPVGSDPTASPAVTVIEDGATAFGEVTALTTAPSYTATFLNLLSRFGTQAPGSCEAVDLEFFIIPPDGNPHYEWSNPDGVRYGRRVYSDRQPPFYARYEVSFEDLDLSLVNDFDYDDTTIEVEEYGTHYAIMVTGHNAYFDHQLGVREYHRGRLLGEHILHPSVVSVYSRQDLLPGASLLIRDIPALANFSDCTAEPRSCQFDCATFGYDVTLEIDSGAPIVLSPTTPGVTVTPLDSSGESCATGNRYNVNLDSYSLPALEMEVLQREDKVYTKVTSASGDKHLRVRANLRYGNDVQSYILQNGILDEFTAIRPYNFAALELDQTTQCRTQDFFGTLE